MRAHMLVVWFGADVCVESGEDGWLSDGGCAATAALPEQDGVVHRGMRE